MKKNNAPQQKLMSIKDYAKECKVSKQSVYNRIGKGAIKPTVIEGDQFIDAILFPPVKAQKAGRKPASAKIQAV